MSAPGSQPEGQRLVGWPFLLIMGAVLAGVAVALHPDVLGFRTWTSTYRSDAISLAYLELELERRPRARPLRIVYVRQLFEAGQLDRASANAAPLMVDDDLPSDVWSMLVELETERVRAATGQERERRTGVLVQLLERAHLRELPAETRLEYSRLALELGRPALAARFIDAAADLDEEERLERAARIWTEASEPSIAADRWLALAELELVGRGRPSILQDAVNALHAADRDAEARSLVATWIRRHPQPVVLGLGVALERAAGNLDRALELSEQRLQLAPDDGDAHREHVELALALGRPSEGLAAARRLTVLRPGNRSARVLRAQVAEWSGAPEEALRLWMGLSRSGSTSQQAQASRETERLARGLGENQVLLELLAAKLDGGDERPELLEQIVYLAETLGEPERARQVLLRQAGHRHVRKRTLVRLARLELRMGLLASAADRWRRIHTRFGTDPAETVEWAAVMWRLGGAEMALDALQTQPVEKLNGEALEMLAELSWQVGERGLGLASHARLARDPSQIRPHQYARWALLLKTNGQPSEALNVAVAGLRASGDAELLMMALELAVLSAPHRATEILEVSPVARAKVEGRTAYWRLRARVSLALDRTEEAKEALRWVLRLDPGASQTLGDLLWLLLDTRDPALAHWYERARSHAARKPELWMALAASASALGRDHDALRWFALEAGKAPKDWRFWLDYASSLERVGRRNAALRLRRYGLRKVSSSEDDLPRLLLGQGVLPEPELDLRARRLIDARDAPRAARRAAALHLLESDHPGRPLRWARRTSAPVSTTALYEAELSLALALEDREGVEGLLSRAPDDTQPALRARAFAFLGNYREALSLALVSRADRRGAVTRESLAAFLEAETRAHPRELRGRTRYERWGDLQAVGGVLEGVTSRGPWSWRFDAAYRHFDDVPGRRLGRAVSADAQMGLGGRYAWRSGGLGMRVGLHVQSEQAVLQSELRIQHALDRRLQLLVRAGVGDVVAETPSLLTLGVRDRVQFELLGSGPRGIRWSLAIDGEHHRARDGRTFGWGAVLRAQLSKGWRKGGRTWELYGAGQLSLRTVHSRFDGELAALTLQGLRPEELLPTQFASLGFGARLRSGALDLTPSPRRRLRYLVDILVGWQWPRETPAYRLEAGLGYPLFGPDELAARGFISNVVGGLDDVQAGLQIEYRLRLDPNPN